MYVMSNSPLKDSGALKVRGPMLNFLNCTATLETLKGVNSAVTFRFSLKIPSTLRLSLFSAFKLGASIF